MPVPVLNRLLPARFPAVPAAWFVLTVAALIVFLPAGGFWGPDEAAAGGPLTGVSFVVDPGHGGSDPGAVGPTGLQEKVVNLRVGLALREALVTYGGATVYLTRSDDKGVELAQRVALANELGVDVFVSVHHNAATNRDANGTETYSRLGSDATTRSLRDHVHEELVRFTRLPDRGVKEANFYVLRYTNMPAILTEASFISNPYQEARLRQENYTSGEALAIYKGILAHFGKTDVLPVSSARDQFRFLLRFPVP